jgi:hypothetical protein
MKSPERRRTNVVIALWMGVGLVVATVSYALNAS